MALDITAAQGAMTGDSERALSNLVLLFIFRAPESQA